MIMLVWGMLAAVLHLTNPIDVWNAGVESISEESKELCEKLDED